MCGPASTTTLDVDAGRRFGDYGGAGSDRVAPPPDMTEQPRSLLMRPDPLVSVSTVPQRDDLTYPRAGPDRVSPDQLGQLLSEFLRELTGKSSVDEVLKGLGRAAADLLPVDGAGVLVVEGGRSRLVVASSAAVEVAERAQSLYGGPARSSHQRATPIALADLSRSRSWTTFSAATLAVGFRSVMAIPLIAGDTVWGVLDLYRNDPGPMNADVLVAAQALVDVAMASTLALGERSRATAALSEMSHRALHDPLTGLANRTLFSDRLAHAFAGRRRHRGAVVVIFIDLNGFKDINDTFGHAVGDQLLREVARRFSAVTRAEDTVARLGGDEFAVLSSSPSENSAVPAVAAWAAHAVERITDSLSAPWQLNGSLIQIRASIGMSIAGPGQDSPDELVHAADLAMYRSKVRDPVLAQIELDAGNPEGRARTRLSGELRQAVAADVDRDGDGRAFPIVYQPVVQLSRGVRLRPRRQLEAFVRWAHPTRGLLNAAEFLRVAEDTELIVAIGDTVLRRACVLAGAWQDAAFDSSVAVNVSAVELRSPDFVGRVRSAVHAADIDASWLRLEITEQSMLEAGGRIEATTGELRALGVGLSLDGFGTGLSSLTHLERFPIDAVKLDRSVVARLGDEVGTAVIGGVLAVTRALGLEVAACGVETTAQLGRLQWLGCDHAQGLLIGRPSSSAEVLTTVTSAVVVPLVPTEVAPSLR
jgi:diguanylate cyclase (GGDEF)-like protein